MTRCPDCQQQVIRVMHGAGASTQTMDLEPGGTITTYAVVDASRVYPVDGDRVFLTTACVPHQLVCPAVWRTRFERMRRSAGSKKAKAQEREKLFA